MRLTLLMVVATLLGRCLPHADAAAPARPNVVFILADDLGSAELGCYGQKKIRTPHLDRMAADGMRFTQFYSGNAVCAPSRCSLMTGKHPGHAYVRSNKAVQPEGQEPIPADAVTITELLKAQGYATGAMGKWGLGPMQSTGDPLAHGFDLFFGYNCQAHAHNHYPTWLWRNHEKIELDGKQYALDLMETEALKFVRTHRDRPFFLYLPFIVPHLALQVPEDSLAEYAGQFPEVPYTGGKGYRPHPTPRAAYAAMITRMDRTIGRLFALIKELGLDQRTLVMFSSDNGPAHDVGGADSPFFESAGKLRGLKGDLYEGGIRVPLLARWPGRIRAGATSDLPSANWDVMPTLCDLAGAKTPADCDGLSFLPTLLGRGEQRKHEFLYWEFPGYGGQQAIRVGNWKAIRTGLARGPQPIQLYDLDSDPSEQHDLAAQHPDRVARMQALMAAQHTRSTIFPIRGIDG